MSNFSRIFYFFLGALLPLPVFYDLGLKSFIILSSEQLLKLGDLQVIKTVIPLPMCFFVVCILACILFFVPKDNKFKYQQKNALILFVLFFLVLVEGITPIQKVFALCFPFFLLHILCYICLSRFLSNLLFGYVFSLLFFVTLHFISACFSILFSDIPTFGFSFASETRVVEPFRFFFGYYIYQSLVSYSAILSFLGCTIVIYMLSLRKGIERTLLFLMSIIIFFVVQLGSRKAILADIALIIGLIIVYFLNKKKILKFKHVIVSVIVLACIACLLAANMNMHFDAYTCKKIIFLLLDNRKDNYMSFFSKIAELSFMQIMFGCLKSPIGWDTLSYHNLIMKFIVSIGLFGIVIFLWSFLYHVNLLWRVMKQVFVNIRNEERILHVYIKMWIVFAICSFVLSNTWNVNFQLPYYMTNVSFISLSYFYFLNKLMNKENYEL
jgi:hypothetical protein